MIRKNGNNVVRGTNSIVYKGVSFSRRYPVASAAICITAVMLIFVMLMPLLFKTSTITVYNPNTKGWTKQIAAYSSQQVSEKKATRQAIDLFNPTTFIVVVDCNYECLDITYQYSDSNEWLMPYTSYLGNDQYSIDAAHVLLNSGPKAEFVTYRIEIYSDNGTETVYFSTKI